MLRLHFLLLLSSFYCYLNAFNFCFNSNLKNQVKFDRFQRFCTELKSSNNVEVDPATGTTTASTTENKVRRIRYSGSYPKAFKDKYKELRGDSDTMNKVLAKGSTPSGVCRRKEQ